ncbi:MAG: response regulator [Candidatus Tectomicrobia bacterium]|uniref:Response regulator n=1 Tax=Tectimicrobiota bacterium TaxID=2528274 RepID=A0A932MNL6_UNCTE|nr:response regulator [Candidatus Tectomicrobia bacterium]
MAVSPKRILLVDDEPEILQVLGEILSSMGYQAETASSGDEALAKLTSQIDLVLLDVRMPGMDGYQVVQRIRKTPATRDIPIIMVTALGSRDDRLKAVKAGANDFIHKPVDAIELRVRAESQLRLKESLDEIKRQRAELQRSYAAEKELLEKTLQGSVRALVDILGLVSPLVFSRVGRIRRLVRQLCMNLDLPNAWQYEFAAMLSQVGWVAIPLEVTEKHFTGKPLSPDEQKMVEGHTETAAVLLAKIPRLGFAAEMIRNQPKSHLREFYSGDLRLRDPATIGSLILRAVVHYDLLLSQGLGHRDALTALRRAEERNDPAILSALQSIIVDESGNPIDLEPRRVKLSDLAPEMILGEDLLSRGERGILLARKGQEVSRALLEKLKNAVVAGDQQRQIMVLIPRPAEGTQAGGQ